MTTEHDIPELAVTTSEADDSKSDQNYSQQESSPKHLFDVMNVVERTTEAELDQLFADRYTDSNSLYREVSKGFPEVCVVHPWPQQSAINRRYTDRDNRPKQGGKWLNGNRREHRWNPYNDREHRTGQRYNRNTGWRGNRDGEWRENPHGSWGPRGSRRGRA
ncbi:hypothetical protein AB6A40_009922 [Gnathostoma spinigerum]|uniref:Uncharacterized protein n=1 Tax=Gnathostoma spinigerum TaxID=75299 RepID=A0ABD6ETC5_9BILA